MSVEGKVFAVTGGGSGMGAAICRLLAERGARAVCACDISSKGFEDLKASIAKISPSAKVHTTVLDVTKSNDVDTWITDIVKTFGDLHGAANVAGLPQALGMRTPPNVIEETNEMWSRIMGVNLTAFFTAIEQRFAQ
ncbi:NAD(P)-binding protein [Rhizodiscina lignyota]|uniref:NAD(P)-binding protein n=1 Tax=Rhizodiscina lignyota TaxID=1504668 RepID=A0A9P4I391_9PEZI|nr:NAD(P)-binding protein [Rhizodiscina lignyota]